MQVTHDKKLLIAIGRSRKAAQWQNREMLWSEFLDKLARPRMARMWATKRTPFAECRRTPRRTKPPGACFPRSVGNRRHRNSEIWML